MFLTLVAQEVVHSAEERQAGVSASSDMLSEVFLNLRSPPLLALQQLAVGGDLDVQGQLEVHQLLLFTDLSGQVLLGPSQGLLQLGDVPPGPLRVSIPFFNRVADVLLQGVLLCGDKMPSEVVWMKDRRSAAETNLPLEGLQVRVEPLNEAMIVRDLPPYVSDFLLTLSCF